MTSYMQLLAAGIGFIFGFAGWPCVFLLTGPLGRLLTFDWNQHLRHSGYAIWILIQAFLILVMFALLELQVFVFSCFGAEWKDAFGVIFGGSFFGFAVYGLLPKLEAAIRGVPRYRGHSNKG